MTSKSAPTTTPKSDLRSEALSLSERQAFYSQLGTLFSSGCSLPDSLLALGRSDERGELARVAREIVRGLERGNPMSTAMTFEEGLFPATEINLVRLGEETGRLHAIFSRLADNLEKSIDSRQRFTQAALYPATIFCFSVILVSFMALSLLPKLIPLFKSFDVHLPWPTQLVLGFAGLAPWLVFGTLIGSVIVYLVSRQRSLWQPLIYGTPLISSVLRSRALGELSASLATLVSSGARLDTSFLLLAEQAEDPELKATFHRLRLGVRAGASVDEVLKAERNLPRMWRQLFAVGCETGRIEYFCERLAEFYLEDFRWKLGQALTLLEPLLLLGVGGFVGFLLLACFLPFYNLLTVAL